MQKMVLASSNAGKLKEFSALFAPLDIEIIPQSEFGIESAEETGLSFIENSILKARHAAKGSGLPAIADDSGIDVWALGGAPGIYSARYAGEGATDAQNNAKLLAELEGQEERGAAYHCVLTLMRNATDPTPLIAQGAWLGSILEAPQGEGGFGYDPLFFVDEYGCTAAELSADVKNAISHRGVALATLLSMLEG